MTNNQYKFITDFTIWTLATPLAYFLRLEGLMPYGKDILLVTLMLLPLKALIIFFMGYHCRCWHKVGLRDLSMLISGVGAITISSFILVLGTSYYLFIPLSVPFIEGLLALSALGFIRVTCRVSHERINRISYRNKKEPKRILIAGAGEAGTLLAREMMRHPESGLVPIGYLDDRKSGYSKLLVGIPVLGNLKDLSQVVDQYSIDEVLIAMPSESGGVVRNVAERARNARVRHRIMPRIHELINGKIIISQIRNVDVEDLLRRKTVELDVGAISGYLKDRVIMVTGAGGSIGSEIVRQISGFNPKHVILLGRGENSIYTFHQEILQSFPNLPNSTIINDIKDYESIRRTFETYRPEVIFHAAAHKHVPLMEANPEQAITNNVGGTKNLTDLSLEFEVDHFVNISSDKAVNPTSVMGASKRACEHVVRSAATNARGNQKFVSVRFGNVLGSRGSVIPLFKSQIERGGPITITHPDMTRYFMTIPEASRLVLQAGGQAENGMVYVLDMGQPVKIVDLANDLITLSGLKPDIDIKIEYSGTRPGEKLYEELLTPAEGISATHHKKIFSARKNGFKNEQFDILLENLFKSAVSNNREAIDLAFKAMVPSYRMNTKVNLKKKLNISKKMESVIKRN
ncbi:MAG: nucleoside-diphosphate sugar epimerase/dehydratase [Balneolales bacterium]